MTSVALQLFGEDIEPLTSNTYITRLLTGVAKGEAASK